MKTKKTFKIKYLILILIITLLLMLMSSCSMLGGKKTNVVAPRIAADSPPRFERVNPDYTNADGKEDYYKDDNSSVVMPVRSNEKVYLVLDYVNKDNLSINKVVVSGGGKEREISSRDFEQGSDSNRTKIEFTIDPVDGNKVVTYTITRVFYNLGVQVLSMTLNPDLMQLKVNVDPQFKLILDHQNADIRPGAEKAKTTKEIQVNFFESLEDIIPSLSTLSTHTNAPIKNGGWSFRGYFTEPNGQGRQVTHTDKFYFWNNVILYAFYERLYTFTVSNASSPIPYEEDGVTKYYDKVATIIKKTGAGDQQTTIEVFDTVADDLGVYPIVSIETGAFENTFTLSTVIIGKYVEYIGVNAFFNSNVTNVVFHEQGRVEKIDHRAFMGTSKLGTGPEGFTLPRTVKYLGDRCFEKSAWGKMKATGDVTAKTTLVIYDNIEHIGDWCFVETKFEEIVFMPGVKFRADAVKGQNYVQEIDGQQVTADSDYYLGWCLFKNCEKIKRFKTLADTGESNGLEVISDGMFDILYHHSRNNIGLTSVTLAEGLKKIGKGAFHYQKLLQSIALPDSLEDICSDNEVNGSGKVFEGTKNEKSEYGAFAECHALQTVTFTENSQLKVIGCKAFYNNRLLKTIRIESKVFESYGDGPFQGCDALNEVFFNFDDPEKIPAPIKYTRLIRKGSDLFYANQNFKVFVKDQVVDGFKVSLREFASPIIRDNIPVYGQDMIRPIFVDGIKVADIALQETTSILDNSPGWMMGYYFGDSKEIIFEDEYFGKRIVAIGSYAFNNVVEKISLPSYVALICSYAFNNCSKLSEVIYGNSGGFQIGINNLKELGEEAFYNTKITHFEGGVNLEKIGEHAFWNCTALQWVDLSKTKITTNLGKGAFFKCNNLKYVRLPAGFNYFFESTFADCITLRYLVLENPSPTNSLFDKVNGAYFQGVPSNFVNVYVPSQSAVEIYNALNNIPPQIKNRFQYNPTDASPDPSELLT